MLLGSRERPERKADNLTAICESTVQTIYDAQHKLPYRPPRPIDVGSITFYLCIEEGWVSTRAGLNFIAKISRTGMETLRLLVRRSPSCSVFVDL
jgi:hypothetical protein